MAAETKANSLTTMTKPTPDGALNSDGYGNPLVDQYRPTPTAKYITDDAAGLGRKSGGADGLLAQ